MKTSEALLAFINYVDENFREDYVGEIDEEDIDTKFPVVLVSLTDVYNTYKKLGNIIHSYADIQFCEKRNILNEVIRDAGVYLTDPEAYTLAYYVYDSTTETYAVKAVTIQID